MLILARKDAFYIVRATVGRRRGDRPPAGGRNGDVQHGLRPDIDTREVDASALGETTNRIIQKYGLPIPETYPAGNGPIPTAPPIAVADAVPEPDRSGGVRQPRSP